MLLPSCLLAAPPLAPGSSGTDAKDLAREGPDVLTASIYAKTNGNEQLLFKFRRSASGSGLTRQVLREYSYPNGVLAARERVVYEGDSLRTFHAEDLQTGERGSAWIEPDPSNPGRPTIVFQYAKSPSARLVSALRRESLAKDTLVNDMVGLFLASHWEPLQQGLSVKCQYVVLSRRETIGFSFKKESESKWHGRDVIILKMQPTNPFVSALVEPLLFTLEKNPPHHVLQYEGRTTPKILQGKQWKDLDAVTVFDW